METILIIILALLALRIIFRFARPYIMRYIMRKLERKMNATMGFNSPPEPRRSRKQKEGEVIIDKIPNSERKKGDTSNLGEYIDYEEIE